MEAILIISAALVVFLWLLTRMENDKFDYFDTDSRNDEYDKNRQISEDLKAKAHIECTVNRYLLWYEYYVKFGKKDASRLTMPPLENGIVYMIYHEATAQYDPVSKITKEIERRKQQGREEIDARINDGIKSPTIHP